MADAVFPFAALVGQDQLKAALLACAVDANLGGVLIRGDKGTAKSTAARALAEVLPRIERIEGCPFNCAPELPLGRCRACEDRSAAVWRGGPVPFVTLPLGATEDRVLGTLDLERALKGAKRVFQPGLLAAAHRGVLYIDEVNLLPDHLVDVLLDAAAMGVNSVQREGLSVTHPARFTLIGTMNPEEGDLRPQLLDRFGLAVEVSVPQDRQIRAEIVRRRIAFEADPARYGATWAQAQEDLCGRLGAAQRLLPQVTLSDELLELIARVCSEFDVTSLRADITMHKTARALAALEGRLSVISEDVRRAAELALSHRRRHKPFEQRALDLVRLDQLMREGCLPADGKNGQCNADSEDPDSRGDSEKGDDAQVFRASATGTVRRIAVAAQTAREALGRRSDAAEASRGHLVRAVLDPNPTSLAVSATVRSAALHSPEALQVTRGDLHQQIRAGKSANLILFVVDASGSMAAQRRMEAVKGAAQALLTDAYQRRDEVAVIAFRGTSAQVLVAPTRSVDLAEQGLRELPTGGRTPLPHALELALQSLSKTGKRGPRPLLILLSDGKANVPLAVGGDPWNESLALAGRLAEHGVPALVLDTETGYLRLGRARQLAQALGAQCLKLEELSAETLTLTIRAYRRAT
ncbi:MAG TPA: magnesium chelatase subunit D family protein [Candidatus Binataceae bacterium]|nr:magnesium chelatase subunit D family protein [Candidatus Binataceae bacterium]